MAIGLDLAFNPPLPDVQLRSDGKLLASCLEMLDRVAEAAETLTLEAFMDQREPDPEDDDLDFDEFFASWDEWFSASTGARTVEQMLSVLRGPASPVSLSGDAVHLPNHLEDLLRCLQSAESRNARFRIEVTG